MFWLKWIARIIKILAIIIGIILIHICVLDFLPFPFNNTNVIIAAILWIFIFNADIRTLFLIIPAGFFLEILSSTPFGINSISLAISLSVVGWILLHILTNRSVFIVFLSGLIAVIIYRFIFIILLLIFGSLTWAALWSGWGIITNLFFEAILTALLLLIGYVVVGYLVKRFRPEYINLRTTNNYDRSTRHLWHF